MFIIYKITNTLNGKSYIGFSSRTLEQRWKSHLEESTSIKHRNIKFKRAIRKYGDNAWSKEVLAEIEDEKAAKVLEQHYIQKFDTFKNGYNSTLGGDGLVGFKHSVETKRFISEHSKAINTPEMRKHKSDLVSGNKHPNFGKQRSTATKEKIREKRIGSHHSDQTKLKMSESRKGEKNHFFGRNHSKDSIKLQRINHPRSQSIEYNGIHYDSINEFATVLGVSWNTAKKKLSRDANVITKDNK